MVNRISIHAPREGGDSRQFIKQADYFTISIHAPREGGDGGEAAHTLTENISIHAPREGGDSGVDQIITRFNISIHAPREGGDSNVSGGTLRKSKFQSTPPARGATIHLTHYSRAKAISIHAPREGGDG